MYISSGPVITTIIPTYRRPKLLRRAIRSVLAQTYPNFQICVYDNASGDETPSVVHELAKIDLRIKYYNHAENIGAVKNFIYGMKQVESPLFSFLSDDDILLPKFYETALEGFVKYPKALFSSLATVQMNDRGSVLRVPMLRWREGFYPPPEGLKAMIEYGHPEWTAIVFRREVLEQVGGLDEEVGPMCDFDFELRVGARFPIVVSTEPGAIFVAHQDSLCCSSRLNTTWPGWLKMIRNLTENGGLPDDVCNYVAQTLTERLKRRLFASNGFGSIVRGNWDDAFGAAVVLRSHYYLKAQSRVLQVSAWACQHFPPCRFIFVGLRALRDFLARRHNRLLQTRYGIYASMLEIRN